MEIPQAVDRGQPHLDGANSVLNDIRFQYATAAYQIAPTGKEIFKEVGRLPAGARRAPTACSGGCSSRA